MATDLASWKDGAARAAVVAFVERVCTPGDGFVPPEARIAVFDNDGTLWCEQPYPIQAGFLFTRVAAQVAADPALATEQPYKAVSEGDQAWLGNAITRHYKGDDADLKRLIAAIVAANAGDEVEDFAAQAGEFLRTSRHPTLGRPNLGTTYAPMRELLQYLQDNGFSNYIVSGGGREFMRPVSRELYGITPDRVIGSAVALQYREDGGRCTLHHSDRLELFDDGPAKVEQIWARIGARPIFAAGNSNGDLPMMRFATQGPGESLALLVKHDDAEREMAYAAGAEKALSVAAEEGWVVASIKDDWTTVFAD